MKKKSAEPILKPNQDDTGLQASGIVKQKPGWWRKKEERESQKGSFYRKSVKG